MDDSRPSESIEQTLDTESTDDAHGSTPVSVADALAGYSSSDSSSDKGKEDESDDELSIFVAEEAYAPLEDDAADEVGPDSPSSIDDAFQCRSAPASTDIVGFDLEQELDSRITAELAAKRTLEPDTFATQRSIASPMEVSVGRGDKMSDEHIGQIKNIMAGIQLSDTAIPEWSRRIPEGLWMPRRRTVSSAKRPAFP
ncbi:hypothetical protein GGI20_002180 [Coemansia sp. BCRC 34301]|nr:hypothetical protein GGI20_002180 [Coemansia sp. BCRC 34301]